MPYQKPAVITERTGLPGTPLGNTSFFVPTVIAKTLGKPTSFSRTAAVSGDGYATPIFINGVMVAAGDTLTYDAVTYNSTTKVTGALTRLPLVNVYSVSTNHTNPFERMFIEGVDFTVNKATGVLDFTIAPVVTPPEIDLISQGTGGSVGAGSYDFAVVAVDANSVSTTASTQTFTVTAGSATVTVKWGKVRNADGGYKVYARTNGSGASTWRLLRTETDKTVTSYTQSAAITNDTVTLPVSNVTKHTPTNSDAVYVSYSYYTYSYNAPKKYFDTESVQLDHGVGSEAANAARLILGPTGIGNGANSMYLVAPETSNGEIIGYQNAITACESIQELILMATTSASDSVNEYLKAHCEDMSLPSNAKERFCLVSTTAANQANTDVTVVNNKITALGGSNKCLYVLTDGGAPYIKQWQTTVDKYNVLTATTSTTNYDENVACSGAWHAIATMGMMTALPDPATPATNKQVYGITGNPIGATALWSETKKDNFAAIGGLILEDRLGNLYVRHGLTINTDSVEDSESSIVFAEAYMAKALRDAHQQYIGKKITGSLITSIKGTTNKVLGSLKGTIIGEPGTPNVYQDTVNPTWIYVTFQYVPIYPCNVIKFEWGFDIAG